MKFPTMAVLEVKKMVDEAIIPTYSDENHYTIYALDDTEIKADTTVGIRTGLIFAFPSNYCCLLVSAKENLKALGGLVDSDYRGEIKVIGTSPVDIIIKKGDIIAKAFILEIATPEIKICDEFEEDPEQLIFINPAN